MATCCWEWNFARLHRHYKLRFKRDSGRCISLSQVSYRDEVEPFWGGENLVEQVRELLNSLNRARLPTWASLCPRRLLLSSSCIEILFPLSQDNMDDACLRALPYHLFPVGWARSKQQQERWSPSSIHLDIPASLVQPHYVEYNNYLLLSFVSWKWKKSKYQFRFFPGTLFYPVLMTVIIS